MKREYEALRIEAKVLSDMQVRMLRVQGSEAPQVRGFGCRAEGSPSPSAAEGTGGNAGGDRVTRRNLPIDWFWPPEMVAMDAESRDRRIRVSSTQHFRLMREAQDPNTPVSDLTHMSNDSDPAIRWAIASNPSTPPEIKAQLKALEIAYDVMES